jgi:hypothetical protein
MEAICFSDMLPSAYNVTAYTTTIDNFGVLQNINKNYNNTSTALITRPEIKMSYCLKWGK